MRGKNKSLLEDTVIIFIVAILIYGLYSFFFSSDEIEKIENKTTIEQKIETTKEIIKEENSSPKIENKVDNINITPENKNISETQNVGKIEQKAEQKIETTEQIIKEENNSPKIENKNISEIPTITKEEIIKPKIIESSKPIESTISLNDEKAKIELFYENIRKQINSNIDKSSLKSGEFVNIRLTILRDGRYEQLTFIEGNKEYFELVKPSINKTFPIEITNDMKNIFPRYFRMKIEF